MSQIEKLVDDLCRAALDEHADFDCDIDATRAAILAEVRALRASLPEAPRCLCNYPNHAEAHHHPECPWVNPAPAPSQPAGGLDHSDSLGPSVPRAFVPLGQAAYARGWREGVEAAAKVVAETNAIPGDEALPWLGVVARRIRSLRSPSGEAGRCPNILAPLVGSFPGERCRKPDGHAGMCETPSEAARPGDGEVKP